MLGVVNRLFPTVDDALREAGSSMAADDRTKELGISRSAYHGCQFGGNQCRKMLKEVGILQMMLERSGSYVGMPYVQALRAFNDVVTKTFGADLDPGYEAAIAEYRRCYMELKLPVNVKNHVIFRHVSEFCGRHDCGLGGFSKQASGSVPAEFRKLWE